MSTKQAVAYLRTSSATNTGEDKDSGRRQREAIARFAKANRIEVVEEFYDEAVSGTDPVMDRPGFSKMLAYLMGSDARMILVENASRFARDLMVQITGHELLKRQGFELVPVDAPDHFREETPTATLVRNILGAVSQFERQGLVEKLRKARDRKSEEAGQRIEGRKPASGEHVALAKRLRRQNPMTHKRMSLRAIANEMAQRGMLSRTGSAYSAQGIKLLLKK